MQEAFVRSTVSGVRPGEGEEECACMRAAHTVQPVQERKSFRGMLPHRRIRMPGEIGLICGDAILDSDGMEAAVDG